MNEYPANSALVLDRDTLVVLGLAGAALVICVGKFVNDPARRQALGRLAYELEIPSALGVLGATVLEKAAQKLRDLGQSERGPTRDVPR